MRTSCSIDSVFMTQCPVCSTKNLKPEDVVCPVCQSDLSSFKLIEKLDQQNERGSGNRSVFIALIVLIITGWAAMFWYVNKTFASDQKDDSLNKALQKISEQNGQLNLQLDSLEMKLNELNSVPHEIIADSIIEESSMPNIEEPIDSTVSDKEVSKYKVKEGETLWSIAKKYYGDGKYYTQIMEDNGMESMKDFKYGMTLNIKKLN